MAWRSRFLVIQSVWAVGVLLLGATAVAGYAGPGPGLEVFSVFASLVAWVVIAVGTVLLWPFYAVMRWLRGPSSGPTSAAAVPEAKAEESVPGNASGPQDGSSLPPPSPS